MQHLEDRVIARHDFHGDWNYTILPAPRPAPEPEPAPGRPGRGPAAVLDHPALTGMPARRPRRPGRRPGSPVRRPPRAWQTIPPRRGRVNGLAAPAAPRPARLDPTDHVLALRLREHLHLPADIIGALLGVDRTTVGHATTLTASSSPAPASRHHHRPAARHPPALPR